MDMLIKLYDLPAPEPAKCPPGVAIRKPIGPEHRVLIDWVGEQFSPRWASEAQVALGNRPVSIFVATQGGEPIGFACYDATARGIFGPIGVRPASRNMGIGAALALACLHDMRAAGYAYAVAGWVDSAAFFRKVAQATEIAGSEPGLYRDMLRR